MTGKRTYFIVLLVLFVGAAVILGGRFLQKPQAVSAGAVYYCPMHPQYQSDHPGDCPICNMKLVKKEAPALIAQDKKDGSPAVYYCPMHPQYQSDHPGDCPICNMKLVKKESPEAAGRRPLSPKDICYLHKCPMEHDGKPCPMLVVAKEGESVECPFCKAHVAEKTASAPGPKILYWTDPMIPGFKSDKSGLSPQGTDLIPVYEETQGGAVSSDQAPAGYAAILLTTQKQQLIGVKTQEVRKRKLTKTIRTVGTVAHDPDLYQAQSEYIQAMAAYERSRGSALPEIAEQSKRLLESTRIRLKHLGLSDALINEMAGWKEPEHNLLFAHPGDPVWMYAQVYEYELPLIHVGDKVMAQVPSLPGELFEGKIRAIDTMVDAVTRTTRIRAQLQDPAGHLKPDMYVNVTIGVDLGEVLAVPFEAILDTGKQQIVFVDKGQGLLEPRDIFLGARAGDFYEVKGGLGDGEAVVTNGNFLIDSESRLQSAFSGMETASEDIPAAGSGHAH